MSNGGYYLGIETSQLATSVAVARGGEVFGSSRLSQEQNQRSRLLVSEIKLLLAEQGLKPGNLAGIFVSLGPGSFTGLRIGIMVAKTLAYAGGVKVKGVPTFQVLADQVAVEDRKLIVVSDAQRGDVFMQEYHGESGNWRAASSLSIMNWNRLIEANRPGTSGEALITGPGLHRFQITEECTLKKTVTEDWLPTAGQTILSGLRETESAAYDDAIQLGPIYVRASAAEEKLGLGA